MTYSYATLEELRAFQEGFSETPLPVLTTAEENLTKDALYKASNMVRHYTRGAVYESVDGLPTDPRILQGFKLAVLRMLPS